MLHHPALQARRLVLVGDYNEATAWAQRHDIDVTEILVVGSPRQVTELAPRAVHLVVLRSAQDWRNPYYFLLRTELNYMHARGATVEWA